MPDPWPATSPDDVVPRATVLSMSGLDYMLAVLDGRFPQPPISGLLDYRLHRVEPGSVAFRGAPAFGQGSDAGSGVAADRPG